MKNTIRLLLAAVLVAGAAWGGETITAEQAKTVAANFVAKDSVGLAVLPGRTVDTVTGRGSLWLVTLQPSGYLLVGGNRSAEPIYTFSAVDFAEPEADSPQEAILKRLQELASEAEGTTYETRWQKLLDEKATTAVRRAAFASSTTEAVSIAPLVKSNWGQTYPFYELSPVIGGSHAPVGCVATAYDQIMRYWEWPEVLTEDIVTEHSVNSTPGLRWKLLAGTDFGWASSPYDDTTFTAATSLRLSREAIFAGMLAGVSYNTQSGAQTGQPGLNRWYTAYTCLDSSNSTLAEREAGMIASLQAGCPFMVSINTSQGGHAVVGDGWKTSDDGTGWVHLNYGWENTTDASYYTTSSPLGIYLYQKPRPVVLNRPGRTRSTLPVTIDWAFPTKGYTDTLTGFAISYTAVEDTAQDWVDDFSDPKGTLEGSLITTETISGCGEGNVLKVDTEADRAYYTWPVMVATEGTVLSYDVRSKQALNMSVAVQLFDPSTGWTTIDTPTISAAGEQSWTTRTVDLSDYAGKGIAVRIYAARGGSTSYNDDNDRSIGVHFDNVKLSQVRLARSDTSGTVSASASARSASISVESLTVGKTYLFQVTPKFNDATVGVPNDAQSCTIVDANDTQPTITSVSSVSSDAPAFTEGFKRNAYFGLNQIGVYGTAAMTKLTATLNTESLVDTVEDVDVVTGGTILAPGKVSVADAVSVEKKSNGNFLVRVDLSGLTESILTTEMILTLRGYNEVGDACQKDLALYFNKVADETRIEVADLPEEGSITPVTPVTPVVTYYTVTFNANGGTGSTSASYKSGATIGSFPTVTREGYTLDGWYTLSDGGYAVNESQTVTANVTYFALWTKNEPVVVDTYTVTFDSNGGSVTLERVVEKDAAIGALPTLTREGYTLDGWYTAAEGGEKISATTTVSASVIYYAHWTEVTGGGADETEEDDPTTGENDFTENGKTYRFSVGVNKTSGFQDVYRIGTLTYQTPAAYNLVLWWAEAYKTANGAYPTGYSAPNTSSLPNDGTYTIAELSTKVFKEAMSTAFPTEVERNSYFPTTSYAAADWYGSATGDAMVKAVGRRIFAELLNGPIGILVPTSSTRTYGAVIWGCEYANDGDGEYAKVIYFTSTKSNDGKLESANLGSVTVSDVGTMPGLVGFNSNGGVIETYYPIVGPAGSKTPVTPVTPTTKTYVVTFDSNGGCAVTAQSVEEGKTIAALPEPMREGYVFSGWFNGEEQLTNLTEITADVTYTAKWIAVEEPDPGTDPDQDPDPVTPVDPGEDEAIGVASNDGDPGNSYQSEYGYEMYDNYWTARKRAIQQGKQLFILSGASWCSNCAFVKSYLTTLGTRFTDKFVAYYSNHDDDTVSPYFHGGLPQYGAADPRTTDAFTGTLNGTTRTWTSVWATTGSGVYAQDRGGYDEARVDNVVNAGLGKAKYEGPTALVLKGLSTLGTGTVGHYELYAQFADGAEMPVDYGVEWSILSGDGTVTDAQVDGRDVAALTVNSGLVVLRATSTFYFTGTKTITVACAPESDIVSVSITTTEVNLEDDATPTIDAVATLSNGETIPIFGFGTWTAAFDHQIKRTDCPELEESSELALTPTITIDSESKLNYARGTSDLLEVCDQVINVTLTVNGKTATQAITVWGPTKVIASGWKVLSKVTQSTLGVVRLQCTELTYNYGGKILKTSDTYFASFATVLKKNGSITSQVSYLRGLTAYVDNSNADATYTVDLKATKVNGKYTGYTPSLTAPSSRSVSLSCLARGGNATDLAKGKASAGFFRAFFPDRTDYDTLADEDADGDGFKNWEEYVLGTDPTDAADTFTLMQGYQHLTAPAASGETLQYKVMYTQRAGRVYYLDAKKNWSDDWTPVATCSLANMTASDVTTFTDLQADVADAGMFFRVRVALYEQVFNEGTSAPVVAPALLVANRDAVIDLSDGSTLALDSFDTDATDPGTVYVKVSANAKAGDTLLTTRTARLLSMSALAPQNLAEGLRFVVENTAEGGYALKIASTSSDAPVLETDGSKVVVQVGANTYDISDAFSKVEKGSDGTVTYTLDATPGKKLIIAKADGTTEDISIKPELADDEDETPFAVQDGKLVFTVKSIPGLKYQVMACDTPSGTFEPAGQSREAIGTRRELTVTRSGETRGFYKIQVSR